jgi:hypothetical protein
MVPANAGSLEMSKARQALFFASVLALMAPGAHALGPPPSVAPEGPVWSAGAGFQFTDKADKKRESLSGIACPPISSSPRRCIAAFDEGGEERYVLIGDVRLVPEPDRIVLLPDDKELDAEGAARDGDMVYVTGSHSPKRQSCEPNLSSRHVFRFKVDRATSRANLDSTGKPFGLEDDQGRLWKLLMTNPVLGKFVGDGKCLGKPDHAANIEGLAARDGVVYFGFREPAKDKQTYILPVHADQLFSSGDLSAMPFTVEVGGGRGIRDLLAVPEGLLLLVGPDDGSPDVGWSVALWDGSGSATDVTAPRLLANLDLHGLSPKPCKPPKPGKTAEIKPEAFTMLEDGTDFRRLLILSDGMCDGGAVSFRVPK